MITKGYCPLPNSFTATVSKLPLTNREKFLLMVIGNEVYRFPEGRESLSKELSVRCLSSLTNIHYSNIAKVIRSLEKKGLIRVIKSHTKGKGSIIFLTKLVVTGTIEEEKSVVKMDTTQKLNIKKEDLPDSSLIKIPEEKNPQEVSPKTSLNCISNIKTFDISSKKSNSTNPAVNLPCPPALTSNVGFSSLGSVLPDVTKIKSPAPSDKAIIEGKAILQEKGFTAPQIQAITQRITDSIRKHTPKRPDSYFLTAVKNEKIKTASTGSPAPSSRQIPPAPGAMVQVQKNSFTETVNRWEEEKKKDSPEETIKKLMELSPDDLYRVILDVDNSPAGKFVSLPKIKASLYIAEFKKRFPEVTV